MAQNNQPMYKCGSCGVEFDSQLDLREHEKSCKQKSTTATTKSK